MFFNFVGISLDKQIRQIYKCDILVGMHQNLLAHMFFMNPGATIIEIFPYGYRKRTFQNFAQLLELKYMYWQNTAKANSVFNWEYVEQRKTAASTAKEMIVDQPLDWTNADSRLYWKSQNTRVDIPAIVQLVKISSYTKDQERFLMYMPW